MFLSVKFLLNLLGKSFVNSQLRVKETLTPYAFGILEKVDKKKLLHMLNIFLTMHYLDLVKLLAPKLSLLFISRAPLPTRF